MPLLLQLRQQSPIPLEVDAVRVENLRGQSRDDVRSIPLAHGNQSVPLGEFFTVSGSASEDDTLVWEGDLSHVKRLGAGLSQGTVQVRGDVGMHLGAEMTGGEIEVFGNAGDWLGAEMHGGRIRVHGNAGDLVGAAYRGSRRGMTRGEILVLGDAGCEVGHTLRRGLIAIAGNVGEFVGVNMIAGTVVVCGAVGPRPGPGLKRGSLILLDPHAPPLLSSFRFACRYQPVSLRILLKHLENQGFPLPSHCWDATYARYQGDLLELGKGEILIRQAG